MNKKIVISVLVFSMMFALAISASAKEITVTSKSGTSYVIGSNAFVVEYNGSAVTFPDAQPFVDENSRTLVPLRFVSETMGAKVNWNEDTQTATITKGTTTVNVTIGNTVLSVVNDSVASSVTMDTKAVLKDNRTFVPVRYVAEALGAWVGYYKEVRAVSDKLCEEHGLSVIAPKEHGKHYTEWKAEKDGKPTVRGQLRQDIDGLITQSLNFTTFLELLKKSGYTVKCGNVKHTAVKPPYSQRFIRLDSLGESYTDAAIEARILTQKSWSYKSLPEQKTHYRCKGSLHNAPKIKGFTALYFHYVYLLRCVSHGTGHRKVSRYMMEDTVKFERYLAQHRFLMQNNIETMSDLQAVKATLQEKIENAIYLRKPLYEERRLSTEEQKTEALSHQITAQTAQLKTLRHDHRLCVQIECDAERIQKRTQEAQAMSTQEQRKVAVRDHVRRSK